MIANCAQCGQGFEARGRAVCCSLNCQTQRRRLVSRQYRRLHPPIKISSGTTVTCSWCGKNFRFNNDGYAGRIFCSTRCRNKNRRSRNRSKEFIDAPDTVIVRWCTKCGAVGALDHEPMTHNVDRDVCGQRFFKPGVRRKNTPICGGRKIWMIFTKSREL